MYVTRVQDRLSERVDANPVYYVYDWYGDPARATLARSSLVVSDASSVVEVIDWVRDRRSAPGGHDRSDPTLHSSEVFVLAAEDRSLTQVHLWTCFHRPAAALVDGTHTEAIWPRDEDYGADPAPWIAEVSAATGVDHSIVSTAAVKLAAEEYIDWSSSMTAEQAAKLRTAVTRWAEGGAQL